MNKKVENKSLKKEIIYDDKEDLEIQKAAYMQNPSQRTLLYVLIILFCIMLGASVMFINSYYQKKVSNNNPVEKIEVSSSKNRVLITNIGEIKQTITNNSFPAKKDLVVENINTLEIETNKESEEAGFIKFNIKYDIYDNDFKFNEYSTNRSDVLVRFSYSHDGKEWTYINNVISTTESTLNPLMGNYYDISGLETQLNVITNYELSANPGEKIIMYWKSETIFKYNKKEEINNQYYANFKIEYKEND